MKLVYQDQSLVVEQQDYPRLLSELAFLHTYATDTWETVTGESRPSIRHRMEDALNILPRAIESATTERMIEQRLNSLFESKTLIWPTGPRAETIAKLKQREQRLGLRRLLQSLEADAIRPKQRDLLVESAGARDSRITQLAAKLDAYRSESVQHLNDIKVYSEAAQASLRQLTSERIDRLEKTLMELQGNRRQESEEQRLETLRWIDERQGELKALTGDMAARADTLRDQVEKWQAEKEAEISSTKEAYRISFATQKAHEYWAITKYERHTKLARKSLWAGIVYVLLVLSGTIAFVALVSGLFSQPIWQTPLALALPLAIAVVAFIWLGRLLARTYMAHMQLAEDAQERATMIETYIALTSAGVLDSSKADEAQRALFRPASIGLLAGDSGPDTPIEVISKAISSQK